MSFLSWAKGVAVSASALIGTCYGNSWHVTFQDACEDASDHLAACLDSSTTADCTVDDCVACEGQSQCAAECINDADCSAIKDAFSGQSTSGSKALLDCLTACATAQP